MKHFLILFALVFTSFSFAQSSGLIIGTVLDKELDNAPLAFANISIKGTSVSSTADISGMFLLENLKDGDYTLVCNFPGYESKEVKVKITSGLPAEVKLSLGAFTLPITAETASVESLNKGKTPLQQTTSLN